VIWLTFQGLLWFARAAVLTISISQSFFTQGPIIVDIFMLHLIVFTSLIVWSLVIALRKKAAVPVSWFQQGRSKNDYIFKSCIQLFFIISD